MNKLRLLIALASFIVVVGEAAAQSAYVGESVYLTAPAVYGVIDGAAWYCTDKKDNVSVSGNNSGCNVRINSYFSGTATIACQYAYSYYIGGEKQYGNDTKYYSISCKSSQLALNKNEITLKVGQKAELTYTNSSGIDLPYVFWSTDNDEVADFNGDESVIGEKNVMVTAVNVGQCIITCEGHTGKEAPTCVVNVVASPPVSISLTPEKLSLREGATATFSYSLYPEDAYAKVSWSSSNESVAKVNSAGRVTAVSEGTSTITVTTDNGLAANATVEVCPLPQQVILPDVQEVFVGYSVKLEPVVIPTNAVSSYKWQISDPTIATVDDSGRVKGKAEGEVEVTVTADNGKMASCRVIVAVPMKGMELYNVETRVSTLKYLIKKSLDNLK